jgi:hypothetical protein
MLSVEDKQKIIVELEQQIVNYSKWIKEYQEKIEAAKFMILAAKGELK